MAGQPKVSIIVEEKSTIALRLRTIHMWFEGPQTDHPLHLASIAENDRQALRAAWNVMKRNEVVLISAEVT